MKNMIIKQVNQKCILLMFFMLTANLIYAAAISEQQANLVAVNFLKSQTGSTSLKAMLHYKQVEKDGTVDFYVFNFLAKTGFAIVTGDDNIEPIIAYSTESSFDINIARNMGVNDWMTNANRQIQEALKQNVKADTRVSNLWTAYLNGTQIMSPQSGSVAPLLTTKWNQSQTINGSQYYNSLCPLDAATNQHCLAGCVATAMAQIMKYWNQPTHGIGSHSYTSGSYGTQSANFGATTYNWAQMPNVMTSTSTHDVDLLMYHCGVAVEMNYGVSGSGATTIGGAPSAQAAYVTYFGYRNSIQGVHASDYSTSAPWIALLKSELDAKRPIQYRGDGSGGHTWVCDGYDVNDMFDMNWGWGGSLNGYFSLTNLSPGGNNFNNHQGAIIGIWPGDLSDCDTYWNLSGNQTHDYTWQASNYVTSTMGIPGNIHITYTASNQIILNPGFHADVNSKFSAKIQSCITYRMDEHSPTETTEKVNDDNLSVYPNPFSDKLTIEFNLSKDDNTTIKLFDIMGKQINEISNSFFTEGKHDMTVDASELPSGIYFVVLESSDFRKEQKIIKVN